MDGISVVVFFLLFFFLNRALTHTHTHTHISFDSNCVSFDNGMRNGAYELLSLSFIHYCHHITGFEWDLPTLFVLRIPPATAAINQVSYYIYYFTGIFVLFSASASSSSSFSRSLFFFLWLHLFSTCCTSAAAVYLLALEQKK